MPPPDDPIINAQDIQNSNDSLVAWGSTLVDSIEKTTNFGKATGMIVDTVTSAKQGLDNLNVSLTVGQSLTVDQTTAFSLLNAALLKTTDSYTKFTLAGKLDSGGITGTIDDIKNSFEQSEGGLGKFVSLIQNSFGKQIPDSIKGSFDSVAGFAMNLAAGADNATKLQTEFLRLSGATGNLGNVFSLAGNDLGNINTLLNQQQDIMTNAMQATGANADVVQEYYQALGQVPGALDAMVKGAGDGSQGTMMLAAAMKTAEGTGQSFDDVVKSLTFAFQEYGLTGEGALQFSAQLGSVSQDLGIQLSEVTKTLEGSATKFTLFADTGASASNMLSGAANILDTYGKALESTGLSGTQAAGVIGNITDQMSNLTIAQKAFLSAQTGGPGGLMGSFQIDKMLRSGDLQGVFDKVRQQMQQQFGKIVTVDEASQSQGAAAQMTRQISLLKQGPLGQFAKNDVEAERILEGFKAAQEGKGGPGLGADVLKQSMDKGTAIEQKSYTVLSDIRSQLEGIKRSMDIGNLNTLQRSGMTAGTGNANQINTAGNDAAYRSQTNAQQSMGRATNVSPDNTYNQSVQNKKLEDTSGASVVKMGKEIASSVSGLLDMGKGFGTDISNSLISNLDNRSKQEQQLNQNINNRREKNNLNTDIQNGINSTQSIKKETDNINNKRPMQNVPTNMPTAKDINVHVTGFCLRCKQEIESSAQGYAVAPQTKL